MKKIFLLTTVIITIACNSQTVSLTTPRHQVSQGAYFKDTFDQMDKFVGTWQQTDGTDTITIIIEKKEHIYNGEYYEDLLIGEYRFMSNGQEIVNTIPDLNNPIIIGREHNIAGRRLIPNNMFLVCTDCIANENRFMLSFWDPDRKYLSLSIVLRYLQTNQGEPEKMTATLFSNDSIMLPNENSPTSPRLPHGEYLLIKQ